MENSIIKMLPLTSTERPDANLNDDDVFGVELSIKENPCDKDKFDLFFATNDDNTLFSLWMVEEQEESENIRGYGSPLFSLNSSDKDTIKQYLEAIKTWSEKSLELLNKN